MPIAKTADLITQIAVPGLTTTALLALALKHPYLSLFINLAAQPFWLYSTWKAYRQAGQIGLFLASVLITVIIVSGIINYTFL